MKYIQEVTKELGLAAHVLHGWENNGWLGADPVIKDPKSNYSRLYDERQLERIYFLNEHISEQKKKGIKKTNKRQMDELLLDKFGGEVVEIEKREMIEVLPTSVEALIELIVQQNQKLAALEELVRNQAQRELPAPPPDYSKQLTEIENKLKLSEERERDINEKLQKAVDYILKDEAKKAAAKAKEEVAATDAEENDSEDKPKKGIWKRIFG